MIKYKGVIFDEWEENEYGNIWVQICGHCEKKYKEYLGSHIQKEGGVGACSILGCSNVGLDDDVEMFYVDLNANDIQFISEN